MATPRRDEFRTQFFADVGNMHVQEIGKRAVVLVKEMFVQSGASHDFTAVQCQIFHQGVFASGQDDGLGRQGNIFGCGIDCDRPDLNQVSSLPCAPANSKPASGPSARPDQMA